MLIFFAYLLRVLGHLRVHRLLQGVLLQLVLPRVRLETSVLDDDPENLEVVNRFID